MVGSHPVDKNFSCFDYAKIMRRRITHSWRIGMNTGKGVCEIAPRRNENSASRKRKVTVTENLEKSEGKTAAS